MPEELPDLDTDPIGWIAYWNALDDGEATEIDAPRIANEVGGLSGFNSAANGFDGEYTLSRAWSDSVTIYVRVKTDGWILAWFDNDENFGRDPSQPRGLPDVFGDWSDPYNEPDLVENGLSQVIEEIAEEIDDAEFSHEDVGLYNYQFPDANGVTHLTATGDASYLITEDVDLVAHQFYAALGEDEDSWGSPEAHFEDPEVRLLFQPEETGVVDLIDEGVGQEPETYFDTTLGTQTTDGGRVGHIFLTE
ncbi:hypothetical protein OB905_11745 [Halobacteria archaeon AArc-dxtr1]|nr:hypothetical protein [Halobacteria archaeon AArc-dxtr1]